MNIIEHVVIIIESLKIVWYIEKKYLVFLIFSSIFTSLVMVYNIWILKVIIDVASQGITLKFARVMLSFFIITIMGYIVDIVIINIYLPVSENRVIEGVQKKIFKALIVYDANQYFDPKFFDDYYFILNNSPASILNNVKNTARLLTNVLSISGIFAILIYYDYMIILVSLISVFLSYRLSITKNKKIFQYNKENSEVTRKLSIINRIFYQMEFLKEAKIYSYSEIHFDSLKSTWQAINNKKIYWGKIISKYDFLENIVSIKTKFFYLIYCTYNLSRGLIDFSSFFVIYNSCINFTSRLNNLFMILPTFSPNKLTLEMYGRFLSNSEKKSQYKKLDEGLVISLDRLSFNYPNTKSIVTDLTVDIKKGEKLLVVGGNGSGKSTLLQVICGVFVASNGNLFFADELSQKSAFRSHGIMLQNTPVLPYTIAQYVSMTYLNYDIDYKKVEYALEKVGLLNYIRMLDKGVDTNISQEFEVTGINFSGGEMQRLNLARIFYKEPEIIILDEPFSSIDSSSVQFLLNSILTTFADKTVILASHIFEYNLFDRTIVMKNGKISNIGNHNYLVKNSEEYQDLYTGSNSYIVS